MIRKYKRNRVSEQRSPRRRMMKESYGVYDLIDYFDVWGNEEDGWDVNDLAKVEEGIYIDDSLSDEEIVDYLIDEVGFFSPSARGKIEVDSSSGDFIEFFDAGTYEPLGRLERTRTVDESYRGKRKMTESRNDDILRNIELYCDIINSKYNNTNYTVSWYDDGGGTYRLVAYDDGGRIVRHLTGGERLKDLVFTVKSIIDIIEFLK